MTVAAYSYPEARSLPENFLSDTYRAMLLDSSFVPDADTQEFVADISADELSGGGYARIALAGKTEVVDPSADTITYDCDDLAFGALTAPAGTAAYVAVFRLVTVDADSPIVAAFAVDRTADGTAFTLVVNASGLLVMRTG